MVGDPRSRGGRGVADVGPAFVGAGVVAGGEVDDAQRRCWWRGRRCVRGCASTQVSQVARWMLRGSSNMYVSRARGRPGRRAGRPRRPMCQTRARKGVVAIVQSRSRLSRNMPIRSDRSAMRGMSISGLSGGSSPMRMLILAYALGVVAHALQFGNLRTCMPVISVRQVAGHGLLPGDDVRCRVLRAPGSDRRFRRLPRRFVEPRGSTSRERRDSIERLSGLFHQAADEQELVVRPAGAGFRIRLVATWPPPS